MIGGIKDVKGTITLADGSTSEFSLVADLGWQQWGATTERLGKTVGAVDAMVAALDEFFLSTDDDIPPVRDEDCEGHESLAGPYMGGIVYCDGSCR